ncbi:MAG: ATP-binding protein [Owenweeksia sp.]|nr:ATP-binding protein [Owenweeksia sp.]
MVSTSPRGPTLQVQSEASRLGEFYEYMVADIDERTEIVYADLRRQLWVISIIMVLVLLAVSIYLSKDLTRDIRILNKKMYSFIKSEFQTYRYRNFKPRNTELANLNHSFEGLISQLRSTLRSMEREKQRAEKTAEYKSLFLANMSHEIRTPLNGVIGMLHMLQGTRLTKKQKQYMDVVEYSANHLLDLVNMILDHSKMDAKKMQLEEIEFDLAGDMNKLIKIFEFKAQEKGLEMSLQLDGDFAYKVKGDSLRIQQVLINLLNNAIKFTKAGEVTLCITETDRGEDWQQLKFAVRDTGIGISKDHQKRLFEAFEQLDGSTTRQYGGTGLGLAISNQLVNLLGGQIEVNSTKRKGSVFSFELKLQLGKAKVNTTKKIKKEESRLTKKAFTVLLAEDNPVNQKVISLMLEQSGASVSIAENGKEAAEKFEKQDFDIILMDLQMPVMDGLEAAQLIKKSAKYSKCQVPIIAVTANAFSEDRSRALEAGMDDFLTKPIRPQEFHGILAKYAPSLLAS